MGKSLGGSAQRYLAPFQRHFYTLLTFVFISTTLDGVMSFFSRQQRKKYMQTSALVKTVGGISLCDGGKLDETEGYNHFFVVFYVFESK